MVFCLVDGVWTAWERWGPCACTGNGGGSRTRRRMCDNPPAEYEGKVCPGADLETDTTCSPANGCVCEYHLFIEVLMGHFDSVNFEFLKCSFLIKIC